MGTQVEAGVDLSLFKTPMGHMINLSNGMYHYHRMLRPIHSTCFSQTFPKCAREVIFMFNSYRKGTL